MLYNTNYEKSYIKRVKHMKENLIKCMVKTENGLIVECELSDETIKELKTKNFVFVRKVNNR